MEKIKFSHWLKLCLGVFPYIKKIVDYLQVNVASGEKVTFLSVLRDLLDLVWQQQQAYPQDGMGAVRFSNLKEIFLAGLATAKESLNEPQEIIEALTGAVSTIVGALQLFGYIKKSGASEKLG